MKLIFKEVGFEDIDGFCMLMAELSEKAKSIDVLKSKIEKAKVNPDMYLMLACNSETGEAVGSLIGLICEDFCGDCSPILFIENVVTANKYRGKGIGKRMFEEIEEWARKHGCHYCVLVSGMDRSGAHAFYTTLGYTEQKGFKKYL